MRKLRGPLIGLLVLLLSYLLLWPTSVRPQAWNPKSAPGFSGPFASAGLLAKTETIAAELVGPEDIEIDERGRITTGLLDGRIMRVNPRHGRFREIAHTGGRPLGIKMLPDGTLLATDAYKGLLRVSDDGRPPEVLVDSYRGKRFLFADDLALLPDGRVLFTDATTRFGLAEYELDALEHNDTGRLFAYDPASKQLTLLLEGLVFANGVAVPTDGSYALISETWAYRVRRVFLSGPQKGKSDVVIDNLPGFPDNISYDAVHDVFWVALASPRDPGLDLLAGLPFVRAMVARLPKALRPKAQRHGMALAIRGNGKIVKFLDDPRPESYSPITSVTALGDDLYFGSLSHGGIGQARGAARIP